jgi:hypothetical protein
MDLVSNIALAAGLAWASGIRLYLVIVVAGVLAHFGVVELPPSLRILEHPLVIGVASVMAVAEFLADKVPGFDSFWDAVHSFIRIPAGAVLAAGAFAHLDPAWIAAAALIGGSLAAGAHVAKAGTRAIANTSPEPFSNWTLSLLEDLAAPTLVVIAILFPVLAIVLLLLITAGILWLLPKLLRAVLTMFVKLRDALRRTRSA